jgi:hypothetical protein
LDAIEKAVRNALEKGDAEDKNFRRRVYVSARHALEKSMAGKRLTQALADEKFSRLSEVAASIESEFSVAEEAEDFVPLGRRSYEAVAPQVDGIALDVDDKAEEAVIAEAAPDFESLAETEAEPGPAMIEDAVTSLEPDPEPQAAALEAIVTELAPQSAEKLEKSAKKPHSRKKSSKKSTVEEIPPIVEVSDPGSDLFEKSEPDWKEVSLQGKYDTDPEPQPEAAPAAEQEAEEPRAHEAETDPGPDMPAPDMPALEPHDDSEQDQEDLRALDDVRFEDVNPFDENELSAKTAEAGTPEPAEEIKYEVRPAAAAEAETLASPDMARQRPELRRGWAFLFILITLLAFFVMALWIAFTTGALKIRGASKEPVDTSITVAPADQPAPVVDKAAPAPAADDWLMIFRPDNPGDMVVDPTIKADITGQGPLAKLRIEPAQSTTGDAAVVFSIGEGILQQLAGKKAVFDIVAAADKGSPTQISVLCDFAGLGDCGRKRYQIDDATSDNLFQIEFPSGAPQGAGEIILNPDVDGKGRSLEIYAIKVRVAN